MAAEHFSHQLAEAEAQLDLLTQLLLQGNAPAYEAGALALRQLVVELAHAAHGQSAPVAPAVAARLQRLAARLAQQREQLARCAMVVTRTLAVVMPQRQPTYQAPGRRAGFSGAAPQIYSAPAR